MSRFICCVLSLAFCSAAFSQKVYFIYLQSEAEQPFFVKLNEKTYSSTSSGYLILSQLKDSSYNFKIGFPQNKWPDQQFSVDIKSKDHGYLLKNFAEKGWGLFDLQTSGVLMSAENKAKAKIEMKEISAFTEILSKAANDPSLKEKPVFAVIKKEVKTENVQPSVAKAEEVTPLKGQPVREPIAQMKKEEKAEDVQPGVDKEERTVLKEQPVSESNTQIKKEDSLIVRNEGLKKDVSPVMSAKEETVPEKEKIKTVPVQAYKKSIVVKRSESSTTEGFGLTFVDQYADGRKDTIQIVIPNSNTLFVKEKEQATDEKKFLDITEQSKEILPTVKSTAKNNCSSIASEGDFLKLRKKMAGQKTEEAMINEAKKGFKPKCFTIEQIKNLGNLFLNEAGKFQFYEAAYPNSSDRDNFAVLQTELKENYFIHRFKNLVKAGNL